MRKTLSEITRAEWVVYQWEETTAMGDDERTFEQSGRRTPDEALQAAEEWDVMAEALHELEGAPAET